MPRIGEDKQAPGALGLGVGREASEREEGARFQTHCCRGWGRIGDVEDLIPVLTRFHREIVVPDIERIVAASEQRLRNEMHTLFDSLSRQVEDLRTEYHMLVAGLKRVDGLQEQVRTLEARLEE